MGNSSKLKTPIESLKKGDKVTWKVGEWLVTMKREGRKAPTSGSIFYHGLTEFLSLYIEREGQQFIHALSCLSLTDERSWNVNQYVRQLHEILSEGRDEDWVHREIVLSAVHFSDPIVAIYNTPLKDKYHELSMYNQIKPVLLNISIYGTPFEQADHPNSERAKKYLRYRGFIEKRHGRIRLTDKGIEYYDNPPTVEIDGRTYSYK
jgi:hypothetical protein